MPGHWYLPSLARRIGKTLNIQLPYHCWFKVPLLVPSTTVGSKYHYWFQVPLLVPSTSWGSTLQTGMLPVLSPALPSPCRDGCWILVYIWSPCRTTGHFLLLVFDDFALSRTILSLVHLVFIMGSAPLDMSLKRVSAMDYNSF